MKTLFRLVVLVLLVGGWGLSALSLHVIRTPQTLTVVPKNRLGLDDTFVDTRAWSIDDAGAHPKVVRRLIEVEKVQVLQHLSADASERDLVRQLRDAVESHVATQPAARARREAPANPKDADNVSATDWIELAKGLDFVWDRK